MNTSDDDTAAGAVAIAATLAAWRARGAPVHDPVRLRFIEAIARRAAPHTGEARRRLDERLAALVAAYGESLERASGTPAATTTTARPAASSMPARALLPAAPLRTPLAELVDALTHHGDADDKTAPRAAPARAGALAELKSVRRFNATWTRLAADHRLAQSLEQVPANAGPLNSQHLVHQALALMREVAPAYLDRFIAQVDALLWLEQQARGAGKPAAAPRGRA